MALFDIFKKRKEKERFDKKEREKLKTEIPEEPKEEKSEALKKASVLADSKIIIKPHVAEKSTMLSERGVYVFKVKPNANKVMVRQEIKKIYGEAPVKVNIVNLPSKKVFIRGKRGIKSGFKKAVVYLKKGEKIEIA